MRSYSRGVLAKIRNGDALNFHRTGCERASLIKHNGRNLGGNFKGRGFAQHDSGRCPFACCNEQRDRCCESQGARACDHEERNSSAHGIFD